MTAALLGAALALPPCRPLAGQGRSYAVNPPDWESWQQKLPETFLSRDPTLTGDDDKDPHRPWHPTLLPISSVCAPPWPPPSPPSAPPPIPACFSSLDEIESKRRHRGRTQ